MVRATEAQRNAHTAEFIADVPHAATPLDDKTQADLLGRRKTAGEQNSSPVTLACDPDGGTGPTRLRD